MVSQAPDQRRRSNAPRRNTPLAEPVRMLRCPAPQSGGHRISPDAARFRGKPVGSYWHRPLSPHERAELRALGIDPEESGGWRTRSELLRNQRVRRVLKRGMQPVLEFIERASR